ncbi:MAG TPA: polysaccharide deacetylase [Porphyromonadaceae bacterium]|nr:polysaccharide deacetylase [Porphyromonadaceae bacterium]
MVLLSFDAEEFDVPKEYDVDIPLSRQIDISRYGMNRILEILGRQEVKATFFFTARFAIESVSTIMKVKENGHEISSHGFDHKKYDPSDPRRSKSALEEIIGREVKGYRMAQMRPVSKEDISSAGYVYNSSLNPTFIPGRYMHLHSPRTAFMQEDGVMQIPASVTPITRIPLFWASFHNFTFSLYYKLLKRTLNHDGYVCLYFHPWEFYPLCQYKDLNMPYIIRHNSGKEMELRFEKLVKMLKAEGAMFITMSEFVEKEKGLIK